MGIGLPEIVVILVLVLILFGAGKLPQVMGDLGKGMKAFKEGASGAEETKTVAKASSRKAVKPRKRA